MRNAHLSGTGEIVPQLQLVVALFRAKELAGSTREIFIQHVRSVSAGYGWHVEKEFNQLEEMLNSVEPQYVSEKQAQRLALKLIIDLPRWLSGYMKKIIKLGIKAAKDDSWVVRRRNSLSRQLLRAISDQPTLRIEYNMHAITQKVQSIATKSQADAVVAEQAIEFPAAPWISKAFNAHWKQLSEQWYSAYASANAVEDRFRLEQLATVHLPDSLNIFAELAKAEPEVKAEAEELLAQQLVAAERQIEISSQRHSKDALTALRAQTAFMQEIAQIAPQSQLTLKRITR